MLLQGYPGLTWGPPQVWVHCPAQHPLVGALSRASTLASSYLRAEFVLLPPWIRALDPPVTQKAPFNRGLISPPGMLLGVPATFPEMEVERLSKLNSNLSVQRYHVIFSPPWWVFVGGLLGSHWPLLQNYQSLGCLESPDVPHSLTHLSQSGSGNPGDAV